MLDSLHMFANQVRETELALKSLKLPKRAYKNVVLIGMGGSALGAHVAQSLLSSGLTVPFEWRNSYSIPSYANKDTLVILSSYSGTTEEVIAAQKEAKKRKLDQVVLTSGGDVQAVAKKEKLAQVIFTTHANASKQPRNGVGYNLAGVIGILQKAKALTPKAEKDFSLANLAKAFIKAAEKYEDKHHAQAVATHFKGNTALLIAAEHLEGNLHIFQNQIHETAKHFAYFDTLSELNHHLLEGLKHPTGNAKTTAAFLINSPHYNKRIQLRLKITQEILRNQGVATYTHTLSTKSRLEDVAEILTLSTQTANHLGDLNGEDANAIPYVEELKKRLRDAK